MWNVSVSWRNEEEENNFLLCCIFQFYFTGQQCTKFATVFFFFFFFGWLSRGLVVQTKLGYPLLSQNPKEFCVSPTPGRILGYAYTTCSYGQIKISCTIRSGSPSPPIHVYSYNLFVLICCFYLICDWSFRLYHRITSVIFCVLSIFAST